MPELDEQRARLRFEEMKKEGRFEAKEDLPQDLQKLRSSVGEALKGKTEPRSQDFALGLCLYEQLKKELLDAKGNALYRTAAHSDYWRHLACDVLPYFIHKRWGPKEDYFFKNSWRIWPKRTWWLIHLVWQGDPPRTEKVLQMMTTDWISAVVERPGSRGSRKDVPRAILRGVQDRYAERGLTEAQFRWIMKCATAQLDRVEPALIEGGPQTFANMVLDFFEKAGPADA